MAEKSLSERFADLKEELDSLDKRLRVLETVTKVIPEEKRRGNPNWVRKE